MKYNQISGTLSLFDQAYFGALGFSKDCEEAFGRYHSSTGKAGDRQHWQKVATKDGVAGVARQKFNLDVELTSNRFELLVLSYKRHLWQFALQAALKEEHALVITASPAANLGVRKINWLIADQLHRHLQALEQKLRQATQCLFDARDPGVIQFTTLFETGRTRSYAPDWKKMSFLGRVKLLIEWDLPAPSSDPRSLAGRLEELRVAYDEDEFNQPSMVALETAVVAAKSLTYAVDSELIQFVRASKDFEKSESSESYRKQALYKMTEVRFKLSQLEERCETVLKDLSESRAQLAAAVSADEYKNWWRLFRINNLLYADSLIDSVLDARTTLVNAERQCKYEELRQLDEIFNEISSGHKSK